MFISMNGDGSYHTVVRVCNVCVCVVHVNNIIYINICSFMFGANVHTLHTHTNSNIDDFIPFGERRIFIVCLRTTVFAIHRNEQPKVNECMRISNTSMFIIMSTVLCNANII